MEKIMSIDNSMFAEYLDSISSNIRKSGSNVEFELDNINDKLQKTNDFLERMSEEMLISNLPTEVRNHQRNMFKCQKAMKNLYFLISRYENMIEENPNHMGVDGWKIDIEKWKESIKTLNEEISELVKKGCIE